MTKILMALGALALSVMSLAQVDPNRVVATINGETITGNEYYSRMEFLPGVGKKMGNAIAEFPPGFLTLDELITEHLFLQLAKKKGVYPSDLAVTDELKSRLAKTPSLVKDWIANGQSEDSLRYEIRYELAKFNLATFGVTITDVEADNYYKKNPDLFTTPKQYKLAVIVVSSADAQKKVDAELAAGKKFNDVASELSEDATKNVNGEYGTLPVTVLGEKTKAALESTKIGQCTTWLESAQNSSQTAFVKFYIEDVLPPVLQELTPDLRRSIRNKRMLEIGSIKNDIDAEMKDMRKEAKIDITIKPFADAYAKFIQAFLKDHAN